ncbi:FxDxF family PEP-CTERM protein [Undibacterium parvum]|uniref:PEP-CTERM sorting domain-containing protein n=1 Tax=Undibacterium parvum TaxID=401471 RepID=A0A3S9HI84_9BURK|nr:FxDxF family PEP-CTERM protein [Undibacterium parvum]AZP11806.1 PEP-CTERM sorting domain-containing protein [Undibacterium parvum]MCX7220096.1 FxDxF family PEP-CTERM protein [Burkholderiales bacterium]
MSPKKILPLLLLAAFATQAANASISLLAIGTLDGSGADLSAKTSGLLENGLAGNLLGGVGSGLAWAGGNTFIATPDRGPNATAYNPLVDDTTSYIARFQTINLALTQNTSGSGLAYNLTPVLSATTLLSSATPLVYGTGALGTGTVGSTSYTLGSGVPLLNAIDKTNYFTGRSDNFDASKSSSNPNNARLDPEAVRVSNDGKSVFVSDEYGPYVYQFDRASGTRIKSFELPSNLAISKPSAQSSIEIAGNSSGRVTNKGMEGLAISPDGKTLVGIMQAPLAQDSNKNVRIVTIDIASGATHQYAYKLSTGSGVSEIVALNDHQFLVDERDGKGLGDGTTAVAKQIFKIDLTGAQDVSNISGDLSSKAVGKSLLLDVVSTLNANGISSNNIPSKIEGMAFGEDLMIKGVKTHTLYVSNDNDFVAGSAGHNKFYVFGVTDADLGAGYSYTAQAVSAVPEPSSYAMLLAGLAFVGVAVRRRKINN